MSSELSKKLKEYFKYIYNNIDYSTYEERLEILQNMRYYCDLLTKRKFEHNFCIDKK